ncbi:hypothetical protein CCACVL1_29879 [Corchorus capsularis]|uniref:Uncharacterized protein n=1 Tax=Corchorus capsularis TaxID=210143 RepID=A0A1R3FZM1_COCAP|nr:hypothetical protein CCACVL1_29879 [Corchorus capsularis]
MEKLSPDSDTWVNLGNPEDLESQLISIAATVEEVLNEFKSKVRQHAAELEANVEGYLMSIQEDQLLPKTQSLELDHDKRHKILDELIKNLSRKIKLVALEQVGVEDDDDTVYQLISKDFSKLGMEEIESEEPKEQMTMEEQVQVGLGKQLQEELDKRFKEFEVKMEEKYKHYEKYGDILERLRKQYEKQKVAEDEKEKVTENGEGRPKKRQASTSLPDLVKQTNPSFMLFGFDKPNLNNSLGLVCPAGLVQPQQPLQTTAAPAPPQPHVYGGSTNMIGQLQPPWSAPSTMPTPVHAGMHSGSAGVLPRPLQQGVVKQPQSTQQLQRFHQLLQLQRQQRQHLLASSLAQISSTPSTSTSSQQQP